VYSTVEDLAKWDANFRSGRVGGQRAIAMLQEPARLNNGQTIPYALAMTIGEFHGLKTYSHSGAYGGYRSTLLRFPQRDMTIITLCNTSSASPILAERVGSIMLGLAAENASATTLDLSSSPWVAGSSQAPADSSASRRRNDQLEQLSGSYYSEELDLRVTLAPRDGYLVLRRPHAEEIHFVALTNDLYTNSDKMLLRVVRDDRDAISGFTLTISRVRDLQFTRRDVDRGPQDP
jgi:hypothetical protein